MRVGLVCPYAFDVPGGVQFHIRDLAEHLIGRGHEVSVLAPTEEDEWLAPYVTSAGRPVPVRYNGSVARLSFGPVTSARVSRWLEDGRFDVIHLHEPMAPSTTIMTMWAVTEEPVVATFHTATLRSRAMHVFNPVLRTSLEKIRARIAVSEDARQTVRRHLGGDAYIIPNGVDVDRFATAPVDSRWVGTPERPTLAFLGRIDEPRKGLDVLLAAMPQVLSARPGARLVVAGPGDVDQVRSGLPPQVAPAVEFLGGVSEADKRAMLASVDLYVAPHTGGESFGIVLVEAMGAGAPVLASNLAAFARVLGAPSAGVTFPVGDSDALAQRAVALLGDEAARARLTGLGHERARAFDWSVVAERIMAVYETVIEGADRTPDEPESTRARRFARLGRFGGARRGGGS